MTKPYEETLAQLGKRVAIRASPETAKLETFAESFLAEQAKGDIEAV